MRRALRAGRPADCPQCGAPMHSGIPVGRGPTAHWVVSCAPCSLTRHVRVVPSSAKAPVERAYPAVRAETTGERTRVFGARGAIVSAVVHLIALVTVAGATTNDSDPVVRYYAPDTTFIALTPPSPPIPPPAATRSEPPTQPAAASAQDGVVLRQDVRRYVVPMPPRPAPITVAAPLAGLKPLTVAGVTGRGAPTRQSDDGSSDRLPVDPRRVYTEMVLDERPRLLSGPRPEYPQVLREERVEGMVVIQFVIGRSGRPEIGSIILVETPDNLLASRAVETIIRSRYRPGKIRGTAVRVIVEQVFTFTLS